MMSHGRVITSLNQSARAVGRGSPLHAWLASVNYNIVLATRMHAIDTRPAACITTYHCGSTAKSITLTVMRLRMIIVNATKMHVPKFQEGILHGCCATKA